MDWNLVLQFNEDSNAECFVEHAGLYGELINILPDLRLESINYENIFESMTKLIRTNIHWKKTLSATLKVEERSKQSYRIAIGVLFLKIKEQKKTFSREETKVIKKYFKALQEYYVDSSILEFIEKAFLERFKLKKDIYIKMEEKIWMYSENDIRLLEIFYLESSRMKINIDKMKSLCDFSKSIYQMVVYKIVNTEISNNIMPALQLLYVLVMNDIIVEKEAKVLFINIPKLMKDTTIKVEDSEKEARHKLNCRREICMIASEYYKKGKRNSNILEWKKLTKNTNEFVEIRNIRFE